VTWSHPKRIALGSLVVAAGALAVVWAAQPGDPPIYDGLPLGAPPYRYLVPPPNRAATAPPTSATQTFRIAGTPYGFQLETHEAAPQASILLPLASLRLPPSAAVITLEVQPVVPAAPPPPGTLIDGNAYRFTAVVSGQQVALRSGRTARITLRHTGSPGRPTVAVLQGQRWRPLRSIEAVPGSSEADTPVFGEMALLLSTRQPGGIGGPLTAALVVVGALGILLVVVLFIARRRRR
jgi:hypothetical protein